MDFVKKIFIVIVLISFLAIYFPRTGLTWTNSSYVRTAEAPDITRHDPEFLAPPEVAIPESLKKKKMNKWLWIGAGVVAAGAAAALGGGGGGGGDGGSSTPSEGDITVKWNE